jgi:hypothetical protein
MSEWAAELDRRTLPEWVRRAIRGELPAWIVGGAERDALAAYRVNHQAHPMSAGMDPLFDAVLIAIVEVRMD